MRMQLALALFVLAAATTAQQPKPEPVILAPETLQAALRELDKGLASPKLDERLAAVRKVGAIDHDRVAAAVARAFTDKETEVRKAAIQALRAMKNPAALTQLLGAAERFHEDEALAPTYFLALGQHGDEKALPVLLDGSWHDRDAKVFDARMTAIAHIRSVKSIEALLDLWNKTGKGRNGANFGRLTQYLNRALRQLTNQKDLETAEEWRAFWREHRDTFKVTPEPQGLGRADLNAWKVHWAEPEPKDGKAGAGGEDPGDREPPTSRRRRKDK